MSISSAMALSSCVALSSGTGSLCDLGRWALGGRSSESGLPNSPKTSSSSASCFDIDLGGPCSDDGGIPSPKGSSSKSSELCPFGSLFWSTIAFPRRSEGTG